MVGKKCKRHQWHPSRETTAEDFCVSCQKRRKVDSVEADRRKARQREIDRATRIAFCRFIEGC